MVGGRAAVRTAGDVLNVLAHERHAAVLVDRERHQGPRRRRRRGVCGDLAVCRRGRCVELRRHVSLRRGREQEGRVGARDEARRPRLLRKRVQLSQRAQQQARDQEDGYQHRHQATKQKWSGLTKLLAFRVPRELVRNGTLQHGVKLTPSVRHHGAKLQSGMASAKPVEDGDEPSPAPPCCPCTASSTLALGALRSCPPDAGPVRQLVLERVALSVKILLIWPSSATQPADRPRLTAATGSRSMI